MYQTGSDSCITFSDMSLIAQVIRGVGHIKPDIEVCLQVCDWYRPETFTSFTLHYNLY